MVELPGVPRRFAVTQAPQSSVSAKEVAASATALGSGLQALGTGIDEGMAPVAKEAGKQAVERAPDGTVTVNRALPIFGRLGEVFAESAKTAFDAQSNSTMQTDLQAHANKLMIPVDQGGFGGDVDAWSKAGEAYVKQRAANYRGGDQTAVLQSGMQLFDQYRRGAMNQKLQSDTNNQKTALVSRISDVTNTITALAREGGTETDAYKAAVGEVTKLYGGLAANPMFGYPKEKVDADLRQLAGQAKGQAVVGSVERIYKTDGFDKAEQHAKSILTEKSLNEGERQGYFNLAMGQIRLQETERRAQIAGLNQEVSQHEQNILSNPNYDKASVDDFKSRAAAAGAVEAWNKIQIAQQRRELLTNIGRYPADQRAAVLAGAGLSGPGGGTGLGAISSVYGAPLDIAVTPNGPAPKAMYQHLLSIGATKQEALLLTGAAASESGMNPTIPHDGGKGYGLFGHNGDRLEAMRQYTEGDVADWRKQAEFALHELRSRPEGAQVNGAQTPEQLARLQMAFERPQGYTPDNPEAGHNFNGRLGTIRRFWELTGLGPAPAGEVYTGVGNRKAQAMQGSQAGVVANLNAIAAGQVSPAYDPWLQGQMRTMAQADFNDLFPKVQAAIDKLQVPSQGDVQTLGMLAQQVGNQKQQAQVAEIAARAELGAAFQDMSEPDRAAFIAKKDQEFRAGADVEKLAQLDWLRSLGERMASGMKSDPWSTAAALGHPVPSAGMPLDFSNPNALAAGLAARAKDGFFLSQHEGIAAIPAMKPGEIDTARELLKNGTPDQVMGMLGALNALPEDMRMATLSKLVEKGDVDPYLQAMQVYKAAPDVARSIVTGMRLIQDKRFDPKMDVFGQRFYEVMPPGQLAVGSEGETVAARSMEMWRQATLARAVDLQFQAGQQGKEIPTSTIDRAIKDVTGGVVKYNGTTVIVPRYGMGDGEFNMTMASIAPEDVQGAMSLAGTPLTPRDLQGVVADKVNPFQPAYRLQSVGDGKYMIYTDVGSVRRYVQMGGSARAAQDPQPFILDLKPAAERARQPWLRTQSLGMPTTAVPMGPATTPDGQPNLFGDQALTPLGRGLQLVPKPR